MKDLFTQIETLVPTMNGWATVEKASTLASLVIALRPKLVLEIGVWAGRSLVPMALACKQLGNGHVIGIDPYDPQASADNENGENAEWWRKQPHEQIYSEFQHYIQKFALQNVVTLHRKKSNDVEPPEKLDILHCDGSHTEQAVTDVDRFASKIRIGGIVIMDDCGWTSNGPKHGIEHLEHNLGFIELYRVCKAPSDPKIPMDDWGVWQRIS